METLTCHSVDWDDDGYPLLALQIGATQEFVMVPLQDDEMRTITDPGSTTPSGYGRLTNVIRTMLSALHARALAIEIRAGQDEQLHASLIVESPVGRTDVPIYTVDGLILARLTGIPVQLVENASTLSIGKMSRAEPAGSEPDVATARLIADFLATLSGNVDTQSWSNVE